MAIPLTTTDARMPAAPQAPIPGYVPLVPFGVQTGSIPQYGMPLDVQSIPIQGVGMPSVGVQTGSIPQYGMPLGAGPVSIAPYGGYGGSPFGAQPAPISPFGVHPFGAPFGMQPFGMQQMHTAGIVPPLAPIPTLGMWPSSIAPLGVSPFGVQLGVPPAPIQTFGAPFGVPPVQAPWAMNPAPFGMPLGGMPLGGMPLSVGSAPIHGLGIHGLGVASAPIPGVAPIGVPPAPIPGVAPLGVGPIPLSPATGFLLSQIALKEAVSHAGDEAVKARVIAGADEAIARTIDDLAGVTLNPWLKTAALAWSYPVATELALLANKFREGVVHAELLNVAGQLLTKGLTNIGEDLAGVGRHHNK